MLQAVDLHRERRQQEDRVALKDELGVVLRANGLATLGGLLQIVVGREVLFGEQLRVEVDLRLEACLRGVGRWEVGGDGRREG